MESTHDENAYDENAYDQIKFWDESSILDIFDDESDGCSMCKMADPEFRKKVEAKEINLTITMEDPKMWLGIDV